MPPAAQHIYDLFELSGILELTIHGSESYISNMIQLFQPLHNHLANVSRRDLLLQPIEQHPLDIYGCGVERFRADLSSLARDLHAVHDLASVKHLTTVVALDDKELHLFDVFECGKSPPAALALSPSFN